jgi:putative membrane protein
VKIRFDYENRTETTVSLNGKQIQTKMPFAVISGMKLPAEHFSEITVTNGKVINDGRIHMSSAWHSPV